MTYKLPELGYAYNALEPYIDAKTMEIHFTKHHQTYVDKLNAAVEGGEYQDKPIDELVRMVNDLPEKIRTAVRNNGGGHANHSLFWRVLAPGGRAEPDGALGAAIDKELGGFEAFKAGFAEGAKNIFGSGWNWLAVKDGKLSIQATANQDSPLMTSAIPILGIDVWEHAYYLKYQNKRADYVDAFFNVINWQEVGRRYDDAIRSGRGAE